MYILLFYVPLSVVRDIVAVTYYTLDSVLLAFGLTCLVTCTLTAYAMKSDKEFSAWGAGYVFNADILNVEFNFGLVYSGRCQQDDILWLVLFFLFYFLAFDTQFTRAEILNYGNYVWKGYGMVVYLFNCVPK